MPRAHVPGDRGTEVLHRAAVTAPFASRKGALLVAGLVVSAMMPAVSLEQLHRGWKWGGLGLKSSCSTICSAMATFHSFSWSDPLVSSGSTVPQHQAGALSAPSPANRKEF